MEHSPPPTKKNKKGKKRKRSSKKCPSDGDRGSAAALDRISGGGGRPPLEKSQVRPTHSAKTATAANVRSRDYYPYPTDYNDHFETPARAYDDIFPLLEYIMAKRKKGRSVNKKSHEQRKKKQKIGNETTIYDPYYCTGLATVHLRGIFQRHKSKTIAPSNIHIQHEKRDFYRDVRENSVPEFDILVTNPPYSGNHKERCLEFAVKQLKEHGRPFFLLMPNYVATKEYFKKIVLDKKDGPDALKLFQTFYVAPLPKHSYEYEHPEGTGHRVSPFASVWFCGLSHREGQSDVQSVKNAFAKFHSSQTPSPMGTPRIATSLQQLIRIGGVSGEKRKNPRQRRKMRQQAIQRANNAVASGGGAGAVSSDRGGGAKHRKKKEKRVEESWSV